MKIRVLLFTFLACIVMILQSSPASAMFFTNAEKIMSFAQVPKLEMGGDINGKTFTLNGEQLKLVPYLKSMTNRYVKLMSQDGRNDYLSFPVEKCPFFSAYKVCSNDTEFLLILSGRQAVSDASCTGAWLIGKYKGNYTSFISIDTLIHAGLIFSVIRPRIDGGELRLIGITRDRNCRVYDSDRRIIGYEYKGYPAYPYEKGYCCINSVTLFWDSNAQWFGIRTNQRPY